MTFKLKSLCKTITVSFLVLLMFPLLQTVSEANGQLVIPQPPVPRGSFQPLVLETQEVRTSIDGKFAKTHITQVWKNNNNMQMEGEFLFPIPTDRATMSNFVLWMDGKKLTFETMVS